jgi:hypothetical protein
VFVCASPNDSLRFLKAGLGKLPFSIYREIKRKKYLYYLELQQVQERKKCGVPIDDPGDVDSDMMQVEE